MCFSDAGIRVMRRASGTTTARVFWGGNRRETTPYFLTASITVRWSPGKSRCYGRSTSEWSPVGHWQRDLLRYAWMVKGRLTLHHVFWGHDSADWHATVFASDRLSSLDQAPLEPISSSRTRQPRWLKFGPPHRLQNPVREGICLWYIPLRGGGYIFVQIGVYVNFVTQHSYCGPSARHIRSGGHRWLGSYEIWTNDRPLWNIDGFIAVTWPPNLDSLLCKKQLVLGDTRFRISHDAEWIKVYLARMSNSTINLSSPEQVGLNIIGWISSCFLKNVSNILQV